MKKSCKKLLPSLKNADMSQPFVRKVQSYGYGGQVSKKSKSSKYKMGGWTYSGKR